MSPWLYLSSYLCMWSKIELCLWWALIKTHSKIKYENEFNVWLKQKKPNLYLIVRMSPSSMCYWDRSRFYESAENGSRCDAEQKSSCFGSSTHCCCMLKLHNIFFFAFHLPDKHPQFWWLTHKHLETKQFCVIVVVKLKFDLWDFTTNWDGKFVSLQNLNDKKRKKKQTNVIRW